MKIGLVIGKFYPPHTGHHYLIDNAINECDKVIVLVAWSFVESISGQQRADWLKQVHPKAIVIDIEDNIPVDYEDDEIWESHVNLFSRATRGWVITDFFCSEYWGGQMAEMLSHRDGNGEVQAHIVDPARSNVSCSASMVRDDVPGMWEYLSGPVKAGLCKRVVICGAESSGTTTLAKALATELKTVVVPEYGRHFDWAVGRHHKWTTEDFMHIAIMQQEWEDELARLSGPILICDTDVFATDMFHKIYLGYFDQGINDLAWDSIGDLYIVTDHNGVEFEDDGTRMDSGERPWETKWLMDNIPKCYLVTGTHEVRMEAALRYIKELEWEYTKPLEYA